MNGHPSSPPTAKVEDREETQKIN